MSHWTHLRDLADAGSNDGRVVLAVCVLSRVRKHACCLQAAEREASLEGEIRSLRDRGDELERQLEELQVRSAPAHRRTAALKPNRATLPRSSRHVRFPPRNPSDSRALRVARGLRTCA
jgi:hypothetical protein